MQPHVNGAFRWISAHRYELALITCLLITLALLICAAPFLLALAALESQQDHHRRGRNRLCGLIVLSALIKAVRWFWFELNQIPHHRWHACAQCGRPIEEPSRAAYCSHTCRSYARLEREALDNDPRMTARAERRLRNLRLRQLADADPQLEEVPF